ncbi:uncharacterized protein AB675_733 [Cyphellophora attinorum]|uniref:Uncharacterized protein n=1 Tax=Cyphellophora attinorum TaxID=1664694 RepID=A0A0N1P1R3_9EURO|nr:uncharacterized protein AB675_733 [Phialophora attinorum]KPI45615.1 hypothetical protein AB675_733 [Phialophora attinorum]
MANVETSYFFPPQWNYRVGGPISLGNILSDPKQPQRALNDEQKKTLPKLIVDDTKPNFKAVIAAKHALSAGVGSSLLQLFGFSADVSFERSKKRIWTIEADKIHVQEIDPKPLYVEDCFQHPDVLDHMQRAKAKQLYMIVGVMAAEAATVSSDVGKRHLFGGRFGISAVPAGGVPVDANVSASTEREEDAQASFGASDFILGYKLREITFLLEEKKVVSMKDVKKGTLLDDAASEEDPGGVDSDHQNREVVARCVQLEEERVGPDDFEFVGLEGDITADGESMHHRVEFAVPIYAEYANEGD